MSNLATFEVKVRVINSQPKGYNSGLGCYVYDEVVKMYHKVARTGKQAMAKCKKHGIPISARKVDVTVMHKDFSKLPLDNEVFGLAQAPTVMMDEMIWKKRNVRRANMFRDKEE